MSMLFLDALTILIPGLMIGVELAVSVFINPTLRKLDDRPHVQALSLFARLLGTVMPFWYAFCLLLFLAEAVLRRHQPALTPLIIAAVLWVAIIIFTIAVLVPINNRIAAIQPDNPPANWQNDHRHWDRLHQLRVGLLLLAFLFVLYAILTSR
jgi:uncharacterized membrane protein